MDGRRVFQQARASTQPIHTTALITIAVLIASACGTQRDDVIVPVPGSPQASGQSTTTTTTSLPVFTPSSPVSSPVFTPSSEADVPQTTTAATTFSTTTTSTTTTTTTTTPPPSTIAPPNTLPPPPAPQRAIANPLLDASNAAFDRLAGANTATSMTVARGGEIVFNRGAGQTIDGAAITSDSPMVVASVSKIVVALAIARLDETGLVDITSPVPWADVGLAPDAAWADVTIRELLDHRSGLPKARSSWFTGEGTCRDHIPSLLTRPPASHRGTWLYSNGNYCLLGLLVEQRTNLPLDGALQQLVFDPVDATGPHLTDNGLRPGDAPHPDGVARLSRLGGAGTLVVSTNATAMAFGRLTAEDRASLQPPGVFTDQYGWGHTGTVDGAKSCIWVLEGGDTVVSATIAGNSVGTGGGVCDIVVPAVATDLGIEAGRPVRTP